MELQFTEDFVKDNGFTKEQVTAVKSHIETAYIPELKKGWDGKANENAEGILTGAAKYAREKFGLNLDRDQGEKWGDYFGRLSDVGFESSKSKLAEKQSELDEKLKNFKGGDEYKLQVDKLQGELNNYKQQVAELEPLKGYDEKYKTANEQLSTMKREVAYGSVKPNFPDTVNKYEADAKWSEFKKGIEEKYSLEYVDGVAVAVDKENTYKQVKLSELVSNDESMKSLLEGRQQGGTGAGAIDQLDIADVPFKVKKDATGEELSKTINEYLQNTKKLSKTDPDYANQFTKLYGLIKKAV